MRRDVPRQTLWAPSYSAGTGQAVYWTLGQVEQLKEWFAMKSTHNIIRALSIGIGLTLLLVTGTAAMIGIFSGPLQTSSLFHPVAITPVQLAAAQQPPGSDSLLYERVAHSNGGYQWVLIDEPDRLKKVVRICSSASAETMSKASGAHGLSCYTLG